MDKSKKLFIEQLLYNKSKKDVLQTVGKIEDTEILHVFAYNYNWDNGFATLQKILNNKYCDLSTALMIFYLSDGLKYLENKQYDISKTKEWYEFIENLYNNIINKQFIRSGIKFEPLLNNVQLYKLKKQLNENESIFINTFGETDLDIII